MFGSFMWWPKGFSGDSNRYYSIFHKDYSNKIIKPNNDKFNILTENYALTCDTFSGGLSGISWDLDYKKDFINGTISNLLPFKAETYLLKEGRAVKSDGARWLKRYDIHNNNEDKNPTRWIESCNFLQRMDFFGLSYENDDNALGRFEVSAFSEYFILRPEIYLHNQDLTAGIGLRICFNEGFAAKEKDGKIILCNGAEEGIVIVPLIRNLTVKIDGACISFEWKDNLSQRMFCGFSVAVYPMKKVNEAKANVCQIEKVRVKAELIFPDKKEQEACFDEKYGCIKIDARSFGYQYAKLRDEDNLKKMDRIIFSLENPTDRILYVPVMFERGTDDDFNPTGMCPILRDAITGEPCGIPIRRTNNWHLFSPDKESVFYAPDDDPRRNWQGIWYHGWTQIELKPKQKKAFEYTCTYATWGKGAFPVSHANLTLIGYAGNQQWEQSALACFGESICYDPEVCLGRATIDDIRPFQMDCEGKCEWTGNVGGGDFLSYYDKSGNYKRLKNMRTYYRSQGPNMTDVTYVGQTIGNAIEAKINVKMGRTDDVVRVWYDLDYKFSKDIAFTRLDFFQIGADNYSTPRLEQISYGNENGVSICCADGEAVSDCKHAISNKNDWWFLSKNTSGEKGNLLIILREYEGYEKGERVDCCYKIGQTHDTYDQACLEIVPKNDFIPKGSRYRFLIEFIVMPGNKKDYYGDAQYLKNFENFDDPKMAVYQVQSGIIKAKATIGKVRSTYPITIEAEPLPKGAVAELDVAGGTSYIPLIFEGVQSPHVALFVNGGNGYEKLDQSLYGNDFWQCEKEDNGYRIIYNVQNLGANRYKLEITKEDTDE